MQLTCHGKITGLAQRKSKKNSTFKLAKNRSINSRDYDLLVIL